jgi:hypothetical protein
LTNYQFAAHGIVLEGHPFKSPLQNTQEATLAKRTKRRAWLAEEVKALRSAAKSRVTAKKIARLLKRTEGAVRQKAMALRLSLNAMRRGKKKKARPARKK